MRFIIPRAASNTIIPAIKTPRAIDKTDFFLSSPRSQAIIAPVHAPVAGSGIATKIINAKNP